MIMDHRGVSVLSSSNVREFEATVSPSFKIGGGTFGVAAQRILGLDSIFTAPNIKYLTQEIMA